MKLNFTAISVNPKNVFHAIIKSIQKKITLTMLLLITFAYAEAQPTMSKALGTSGFSSVLGSTSSRKSQQIYLPGDLTGAVNGNITHIFFRYHSAAGTNNYTNFSIKMGQTTASVFNPSATFFTGLSTVYGPGNHTIVTTGLTSGDWFSWALDVPFNYDPTQTLIVEIEYDNPSTISPAITVRTTTVSAKRVISSTFQAATGSTNTAWPDIGFTVVAPPPNDAGVVAISSPVSQTSTGNQDITVSIRNFGTAILDDIDITYDVNGGIPVTQSFSNLGLASGAISSPINLGSFNFNQLGKYVITASTSLPNGVADAIPANDAFTTNVSICDPLSGNYTIDQTAPFSVGTTFTSFADALEFLTFCGITDPVTFNVINGPYSEQVTIPFINGVTALKTITFNGNGQTVTHDGTGTGRRSTILLDGAQYVSVNNFVINATGSTTGYGVHLFNGASNNSITGNTINVPTHTTQSNAAGIVASGSLTVVTTAASGIDNNSIHGNTISGGYQGIIFTGPTQTGNRITNNTILDFHGLGIWVTGNVNSTISGNDISRPTYNTTLSTAQGIVLSTGTKSSNVFNNRVHNMYDNVSTGTTFNGIHITTGATGPANASEENKIYNNLIYNILEYTGAINGILHTGSSFTKVYYNTINLDDTLSNTGVTRGYSQTTAATDIEFINNIISITRGGTGVKSAVAHLTAASSITSNNNVLYVNATNGHVGLQVGTNRTTLNDWSSNTGQDLASTDFDPMFTSPSNFLPTNSAVNNLGINVGVTHDIDGNLRNISTPDPGAYEWTPAGTDASISWVAPSLPTTAGLKTITVNIANTMTTTITSVQLQYTDGSTTVTQTFPLSLTPGSNIDLDFSTQYNATHPTIFTVSILEVNGTAGDDESSNDVVSVSFCIPLSGTYTINQTNPTNLAPGVENFNSFNDLSSFLSNCGMDGSIVINVAPGSGPYVEQVTFSNIFGLGASAGLTINGNGETITYLTTSADRHIIRLTDLSHVTLNDLRIERDTAIGNSSINFFGIHIYNSGNNITINNVTVDMTSSTATSTATGIVASGSLTSNTTTGSFSNISVTNNLITNGGAFGIAIAGAGSSGITISGNEILGSRGNGIYISGTINAQISGNTINFQLGNGIQIASSANSGTLVEKNIISATNPTASSTFTGILSFGSSTANPTRIINNLIWKINAPAASIIALEARTTGTEFYFNTVILDDQTATGTLSFGYSEQLSNLGSVLQNNIFYITRSSSNYSSAIALASSSTITTAINSNNNVFYVAGIQNYVAVRKGTLNTNPPTNIYVDLVTWNTASSKDAASFETDPFFEVGTAIPTSGIINGGGVTIAGITTDFTGATRTSPPDPGAYEFTPAANDAAITAFDLALPSCGTIDIGVVLSNSGSTVLNSVNIEWFVNGVSQGTQNYTGLNLAAGANVTITVGTQALLTNTLYEFTATASSPNGATDANPVNDSFTKSGVRAGLSGTLFTIDQSSPVSGTNFTTFQSFATDLATYGVCGPVTATVMNGPYTEQVEFASIPGSSFTNTVTLDGNLQELNFNPTSSANDHIIKLDGVNYFVIENITVRSTNANNGRGIFITNGASKILLQNNIVEVTKTNSGSTAFPIIASGANWLNNGTLSDSIAIIGNTVIGGYVGIQFSGESTSPITNVFVSGNLIQDQYINGIQTNSMTGFVVSGNEIARPTRLNSDNYYGIHLNFRSNNFLTEKNKIHSLQNSGMALAHLAGGIRISGTSNGPSTGTIANNLIYNLTNTSTQYGINDEAWGSGTLINIYHNTIALNDVTMAGSATTTAIGITATSTPAGTHNLQNNVLNIARGGTGTKRLIDVTSASAIISSNYNVFWFGTNDGTLQVARVATNLYPTLTDWQVTGNDLNSVYADPMFADPSTGNYQPTNSVTSGTLMNTSQVGGITVDINDVTRSTTPAPGAFEWSAFCEAPPTAGTATLETSPVCYNQSATITVNGTSSGIGLTTQWEYSTDNTVWNPVIGQTGLSLTTDPLTDTTYFRLAVTCEEITTYSNVIEVAVEFLNPVIVSTDSVICADEFAVLSTYYSNITGYTHLWNPDINGNPQSTDPFLNVGSAGAGFPNTVIVISANGCTSLVSDPYIVSTVSYILDESSIVIQPASCVDGYIEFILQGYLLPSNTTVSSVYWYSVDGSAYASAPPGSTPGSIQIPLTGGLHDISVLDTISGCVYVVAEGYEHPQYDPLDLQVINLTGVSCNGLSNGSGLVSASGGSGDLTVTWLLPTPKEGESQSNLPGGSVTIQVIDNETGCTYSITVTIPEPDVLVASVTSQTNVSCNGLSDASVTISATGGTTPYSGDGVHTGLSAGTHEFIVTDANGCADTISITISEPIEVNVSATTTNVSCYDLADGTITVTAPAGATVTINGQVPASTYGPGTYTVVASVPDGNGVSSCSASTTVTITEPIEVTISATSTNVTCNGFANGTISSIASAGASITVDGKPYDANSNYGPGTYTVIASAANGNNDGHCTATTTVTITEPDPLTVSVATSNSTYSNANNGTATATPSGGTPDYTYLWSTNSTASSISGLTPGVYTVTVTDANGCTVSATVSITEPGFVCSGNSTHVKWGPGGWGGTPNGTNPATYLYDNFAAAFPTGLTIGHPTGTQGGCNRSMKWTTEQAITAFLPSTGTPRQLNNGHSTNLTAAQYGNTFAAQVVTLTLNVVFDAYDPNFSPGSTVTFGDMIVCINGSNTQFNGWTVKQLLAEGNRVLACGGNKNYLSSLSNAIDAVNNTNNATCCPSAPAARVVLPDPMGQKLSLNVFPNPTNGMVSISFEVMEENNLSLSIMDLSGRIMTSEVVRGEEGLNTHSLDLTGVAKGIYIIRLANENDSETLRLVVQ